MFVLGVTILSSPNIPLHTVPPINPPLQRAINLPAFTRQVYRFLSRLRGGKAHVTIAFKPVRAKAQAVCYKHNFIILVIGMGVRR
jgi:hypothetical protein